MQHGFLRQNFQQNSWEPRWSPKRLILALCISAAACALTMRSVPWSSRDVLWVWDFTCTACHSWTCCHPFVVQYIQGLSIYHNYWRHYWRILENVFLFLFSSCLCFGPLGPQSCHVFWKLMSLLVVSWLLLFDCCCFIAVSLSLLRLVLMAVVMLKAPMELRKPYPIHRNEKIFQKYCKKRR